MEDEILKDKINEIQNNLEQENEKIERRGRKKGSKNKEKEKEIETDNLFFDLNLSCIFDIILDRFKLQKLNKIESDQFNIVANKMITKYANFLKGYEVESQFVLVLSTILLSRVDLNKIKVKNENEKSHSDIRQNRSGQIDFSEENNKRI